LVVGSAFDRAIYEDGRANGLPNVTLYAITFMFQLL
jgi:hypothetical protein